MPPQAAAGEAHIWLPIIIAIGQLLLTLAAMLIGGTWALSRYNSQVSEQFNKSLNELNEKHTEALIEFKSENSKAHEELEKRLTDKIEEATRRYGEALTALREKITQVELWNRDNFVSKGTFRTVVEDFKTMSEKSDNRIDLRLDRMERKIDLVLRTEPTKQD